MNSAVERTCNASGLNYDSDKKNAQDLAAGSVLVFSLTACLILGLMVTSDLEAVVNAVKNQPWAWLSLAGLFVINVPLCLKLFGSRLNLVLTFLSAAFHFLIAFHMNNNMIFLFLSLFNHAALIFAHHKTNK